MSILFNIIIILFDFVYNFVLRNITHYIVAMMTCLTLVNI